MVGLTIVNQNTNVELNHRYSHIKSMTTRNIVQCNTQNNSLPPSQVYLVKIRKKRIFASSYLSQYIPSLLPFQNWTNTLSPSCETECIFLVYSLNSLTEPVFNLFISFYFIHLHIYFFPIPCYFECVPPPPQPPNPQHTHTSSKNP